MKILKKQSIVPVYICTFIIHKSTNDLSEVSELPVQVKSIYLLIYVHVNIYF